MIQCPPLSDIEHGHLFAVRGEHSNEVTSTGAPCDNVTNGNSCHYGCEDGYWLDGSPVMTCNDTGQWEGTPPVCRGQWLEVVAPLVSCKFIHVHCKMYMYIFILVPVICCIK